MLSTLGDLASAGCGSRGVVVARELTKLHEEFYRGTVSSAYQWFSAITDREGRLRGEFTLVLAPLDGETIAASRAAASEAAMEAASVEVIARLEAGGRLSRVTKAVAAEFGVPKSKVYSIALAHQQESRQRRKRSQQSQTSGDLDVEGMGTDGTQP